MDTPICPVCKGDCGRFFIDLNNNEIVGCENCYCVEEVDAGEYQAEKAQDEADFYKELCGFGVDR